MEVIKRDGSKVAFDGSKIENAILKAMRYGSGIVKPEIASKISHEIEDWHKSSGAASISIYRIEGQVFEKLIEKGEVLTAKAYEGYRKVREFQRETNTIDNAIYGIVNQTNKEAMDENSNKDATVLATQRDLIAGEFSRDYCRRLLLPPKIVQAHDDGIIHFHDMDYYIQKMHNCDLVNLKDMFANGTVINDKLIETPKSLQTACTVATQIVQQVANGQYGGQTISISHLAPYVRVSYKKHLKAVRKEGKEVGIDYTEEQIETKYAREGEYSKVLTLPVGKKLAMSESSSSANAGINVLFAFPEYDEESYSIEAVADNEFRITNNSTKAVLQVRAINSNGVIMTKAQLKENLPELQPYDWNGYSVYEWTEHGNNKKFYLHYFFESQNKTWGFGYEIVSAMAYDSEITTDYEWGREIFRKLKIEEVTISE